MTNGLSISVELLNSTFHGRTEAGPEWPPSPMRLFQALTAAAAALWPGKGFENGAGAALRWLSRLEPPMILAPRRRYGTAYRVAVPNNDLDIVATDWSRGREPRKQPNELKTLKPVQRVHVAEASRITYLWQIDEAPVGVVECLARICRAVSHLGWGTDLAACHLELRVIGADRLADNDAEVWRPVAGYTATRLRTPREPALTALQRRHEDFLTRLAGGELSATPPLDASAYSVLGYAPDTAVSRRPVAAFELRTLDSTAFRVFDPVRSAVVVAGMLRHAVARTARRAGWTEPRINILVHGHSPDGREVGQFDAIAKRFSYLPLPTIERIVREDTPRMRLEAIRRVLIAGAPDLGDEVRWLEHALAGAELVDEGSGRPVALLQPVTGDDWVLGRYVDRYSTWVSTTPVLLPGFDDRKPAKTERLIRRSLVQSGIPALLAERARLSWSPAALFPGADAAWRYRRPTKLGRSTPIHLRVAWLDAEDRPVAVPGPLAFGSGRYRGLGVMAGE